MSQTQTSFKILLKKYKYTDSSNNTYFVTVAMLHETRVKQIMS